MPHGDRRKRPLFSVDDEKVDRNIIPYATSEFDSLIEELGNIQGPNLLRKLLDFNFSTSEFVNRNNPVVGMIKSLFIPKQSVVSQMSEQEKLLTSNAEMRVIFTSQLLTCLQKHYLSLSLSDRQALAWVPGWCKKKSRVIRGALLDIDHNFPWNKIILRASLGMVFLVMGILFAENKRLNVSINGACLLIGIILLKNSMSIFTAYDAQWASERKAYITFFGGRAIRSLEEVDSRIPSVSLPPDSENDLKTKAFFRRGKRNN